MHKQCLLTSSPVHEYLARMLLANSPFAYLLPSEHT
jgi:hypothetical protein